MSAPLSAPLPEIETLKGDLLAAVEAAMTMPALAPFMALIDPASLTMAHNRLISAVN